jgi:hypothetical protein
MGELGDALMLMHGADDRFYTVRAVIRDRINGPLAARAKDRFALAGRPRVRLRRRFRTSPG